MQNPVENVAAVLSKAAEELLQVELELKVNSHHSELLQKLFSVSQDVLNAHALLIKLSVEEKDDKSFHDCCMACMNCYKKILLGCVAFLAEKPEPKVFEHIKTIADQLNTLSMFRVANGHYELLEEVVSRLDKIRYDSLEKGQVLAVCIFNLHSSFLKGCPDERALMLINNMLEIYEQQLKDYHDANLLEIYGDWTFEVGEYLDQNFRLNEMYKLYKKSLRTFLSSDPSNKQLMEQVNAIGTSLHSLFSVPCLESQFYQLINFDLPDYLRRRPIFRFMFQVEQEADTETKAELAEWLDLYIKFLLKAHANHLLPESKLSVYLDDESNRNRLSNQVKKINTEISGPVKQLLGESRTVTLSLNSKIRAMETELTFVKEESVKLRQQLENASKQKFFSQPHKKRERTDDSYTDEETPKKFSSLGCID